MCALSSVLHNLCLCFPFTLPLGIGICMCVQICTDLRSPCVDITHMTGSTVDRVEEPALVIRWTSTRIDMVQKNWVPNHFVAVVPQSCKTKETATLSLPHEVPPPEECLGQYAVVW